MTQALAGRVVVVTRPAAQAGPFAELVREAGGEALLLPTLEIEALELDGEARRRLAPDDYDWTIFTSSNAVESALRQLPRPTRTRVAAIGRATARALGQHGIAVDAVPRGSADSEGLLELECFSDLGGQRVLILKGVGGRTLLREELARRGAEVVTGDVYRRRRASVDDGVLARLAAACDAGRAAVVVTSAEGLASLQALAPPARCPRLADALLVVPGARVAEAARREGWRGLIEAAASAEDRAMAEALCDAVARPGDPAAP